MFGFNKNRIPEEETRRFELLRARVKALPSEAPLMPRFRPRRGLRRYRADLKRVKVLPAGTPIEFEDLGMNGPRAWYKIRVAGSLVEGWINGLHFDKVALCQ